MGIFHVNMATSEVGGVCIFLVGKNPGIVVKPLIIEIMLLEIAVTPLETSTIIQSGTFISPRLYYC